MDVNFALHARHNPLDGTEEKSMETLYIATKNTHKVEEFRKLLAVLPFSVRSLPQGLDDCPENGISFESNAVEKAVFYARQCGGWVLADDSGLCVDVLSGAPGVLSARYAGIHGDDLANNEKLLTELVDVPWPQRTASFVCALALWNTEQGRGWVVRGNVDGYIAHAPSGAQGFGYDPLFYVPQHACTFAELSAEDKNAFSHRGRAVHTLIEQWSTGY